MTVPFLEELKIRQVDAQKRMQAAQQELGQVQARFQSIAQEFNSLTLLVNVETAKQKTLAAPVEITQAASIRVSGVIVNTGPAPQVTPEQAAPSDAPEITKTEMIRELLRQYPAGITATEIWKHVKTRMVHRAYLYSVLKRLRDKGEVMFRRGKYVAKIMPPKSEEEKEQGVVVQ